MKAPNAQRILLVDLGSQFTQKIAIIVRHFQVYSEILPYDCQWEKVTSFQPTGVIFYGDLPENAQAAKAKIDARFFDLGVPLLGIGYGMQVIVEQLGGKVEYLANRNPTEARVQVSATHNWLTGINDGITAEQGEFLDLQICSTIRIAQLPEGFTPVAQTPTTIVAIENSNKRYYGHLFHTDSSRSNKGQDIVYRFITDICGCARTWSAANIVEYSVANIREQVGQDHVLLGLSGGVDSSVVAALLHKAIGAQLTCVFVDNGLLRLNEGKQVMETFANHMGVRVIHVNAEERFLSALAGVDDPEQKRKIIGHTFIDIFDEEAAKLSDVKWLAQGTIYSDVIESIGAGGDKAKFVKSHHNVGGLPENMQLKLLEPLRNLFKDDVRKIGAELGLPLQMINRHPFPGPGIGVRILGAVNKSFADILRQADHIFIDELYQSDLYGKVSQAFAVFLPIKSVGVANDERRYDFVIALRAVETIDFMTARWAHLPYELLDKVSQRIINEVDGVSRVVYDISGKPPATIEWE